MAYMFMVLRVIMLFVMAASIVAAVCYKGVW